jgi:hypothetical protein
VNDTVTVTFRFRVFLSFMASTRPNVRAGREG